MEKIVKIGNSEVRMRATALIPRLYRAKFGKDLIAVMRRLMNAFCACVEDEEKQFSAIDLTLFENVAWTMIKAAGEDIPDTPEEWLDSIDGIFDIYNILPEIIDLWAESNQTTSTPKKK